MKIVAEVMPYCQIKKGEICRHLAVLKGFKAKCYESSLNVNIYYCRHTTVNEKELLAKHCMLLSISNYLTRIAIYIHVVQKGQILECEINCPEPQLLCL